MKELSNHAAALGRHGAKKRWKDTSADERARVMELVRKGRGKEIAAAVQSERQELRKQNMDPDRVFTKRREERAEVLAAR